MNKVLSTLRNSEWTVTEFHDTFVSLLREDARGRELRLYFYAATQQGWKLVQRDVRRWRAARPDRQVTAYIGVDHGITDVEALRSMRDDGVAVRLLVHYNVSFR